MKKENYINNSNIKNRILTSLTSEIRFKQAQAPTSGSALLVVDVQKYFTDVNSRAYLPAAKEALPNIVQAIGVYRALGLPVVFTKHIDRDELSPMLRFWRGGIQDESIYAGLDDSLNHKDEVALEKPSYDAFYNTDLNCILADLNINHLCICGAVAHLCVESTARSAFVHGYDCSILADCVADYNYEFHYGTVRSLAHGFASIAFLDDLTASDER